MYSHFGTKISLYEVSLLFIHRDYYYSYIYNLLIIFVIIIVLSIFVIKKKLCIARYMKKREAISFGI
jgi:hypothetical protein